MTFQWRSLTRRRRLAGRVGMRSEFGFGGGRCTEGFFLRRIEIRARGRGICGITLAGGPVPGIAGVLVLDIGNIQAGIDAGVLAADKVPITAAAQPLFKQIADQPALAEAPRCRRAPRTGQCRATDAPQT
ncbi:MAG: hypothetical protein AAF681_12215 [Pseudomonadota bacterium]